jgi:hypothetical protein
LKTKKLFSIIILLLLTQSCFKDKSSNPCGAQTYSYQTLDSTSKSKVPYLKTQFDTISYASNKGDTLVFVRQAKDSGWYCKDYYSNKDCLPNYNCYETYGAKYSCIKGNGSFEFKHGKALYIYFEPSTKRISDLFSNFIEIKFNDLHFLFQDTDVDRKNVNTYSDSVFYNKQIFYSSYYSFHEFNISAKGKGCYNKEYGIFHVDDVINNVNWTIIKK